MKTKVELTVEAVRAVIDRDQPKSLTSLAHGLGYKGSVSSSVTGKLRKLVPGIDALLASNKTSKANEANKPAKQGGGNVAQKAPKVPKAEKPAAPVGQPAGQPAKGNPSRKAGKWPRDSRNVFRPGSAYGICFDILAAHPDGLPRERLVELLAHATGKDAKRAAFDAQVVLSARPNEDGLSSNDGPRHRSCRPGFWVRRTNGHVQLVVDRAAPREESQ